MNPLTTINNKTTRLVFSTLALLFMALLPAQAQERPPDS
jgi:hypothetical protein